MIITGLVGALVVSSYKVGAIHVLLKFASLIVTQWGYFVFGCFALFGVVWTLTWTARKHAAGLGADVSKAYLICGVLTVFLWFLYPIAWGLCEGGNVISPDSEAVFYGILDLFAKPVFGALLLWGHRGIDPGRLGCKYYLKHLWWDSTDQCSVNIRDYDDDPAIHGGVHSREKNGNNLSAPGQNGVDGGTTV